MSGRFGVLSCLLPLELSLPVSALRLCHHLPIGTRPEHEPPVLCSIGSLAHLGTKGMGSSSWLLDLRLTHCPGAFQCPPCVRRVLGSCTPKEIRPYCYPPSPHTSQNRVEQLSTQAPLSALLSVPLLWPFSHLLLQQSRCGREISQHHLD